jgi:imidazolonepropionase-like amidohydrolase
MITAPEGHPVGMLKRSVPWWLRWYVLPRAVREVGTEQAANETAEALLAAHPDFLKVVIDAIPPIETARPTREVVAAIVAAGHARNVRSVAHIGRSEDAIEAVRAGVDALAHGVYREEMSEEAVAAVAAAHIPVMPTIAVFDAAEVMLATQHPDFLPIEREIVRPRMLASFFPVPASYDRAPLERFVREVSAAHQARRTNVAKLRSAGITILAGSDACNPGDFPGAGLHVEIRKLVEAGLSAAEALRAATYENAHFLAGNGANFGEIAPGQRADLVVVDGDPVADITTLDRIGSVFLEGVRLERHGLPREG